MKILREKLIAIVPVIISLMAVLVMFVLYNADRNLIKKDNIDEYILTTENFVYDIETVENGNVFSYISGYCYNPSEIYDYYNFGHNIYGKGVYLNIELALVDNDKVYILPAVQEVRADLLDEKEAEALEEIMDYNFFAGIKSKFINFLLKEKQYNIAIIYHSFSGEKFLIVTDKVWTKQ